MNKIVFLCCAAIALPICAMEEVPQLPKTLPYDKKDAQEEFLFWRCKKAIKLYSTFKAQGEPNSAFSLPPDQRWKNYIEEICTTLALPQPTINPTGSDRDRCTAFKKYLLETSFGLCMSHKFQRKDLQALQAEWKAVAQLTHTIWWPGMAEVMFLKKSLTLFKDIKNPAPYQHERKPFNLLAFNLKKCTELNNALRSIQATRQPMQPGKCAPIAWHASEKERDAAFRNAIFQQGPC